MSLVASPEILPFLEAIEYWKKKIVLANSLYTQLEKEVKKRAFSISGINNLDELQTIYNAIQESITHGLTYLDFQDKVKDVMEAHGWTYPNNWRVKNIYRNSLQESYNAGRYKQMNEENDTRPYRMYVTMNDENVRPNHAAFDGMIFRYDDPIWDKIKPRNGFGCRCGVINYSQDEIESLELKVLNGADVYGRPYENKEKGIYVESLQPDEGWDFDPENDEWDPDMSKYPQALQDAFAKYMQGI